MSFDKDAAKAEYSVTDMTGTPHVTYFFNRKKEFISAYMRPSVFRVAPRICVGWSGDDVPQRIKDAING